jgi:hypothetical protein
MPVGNQHGHLAEHGFDPDTTIGVAGTADLACRPNQILAVGGLPFRVIGILQAPTSPRQSPGTTGTWIEYATCSARSARPWVRKLIIFKRCSGRFINTSDRSAAFQAMARGLGRCVRLVW